MDGTARGGPWHKRDYLRTEAHVNVQITDGLAQFGTWTRKGNVRKKFLRFLKGRSKQEDDRLHLTHKPRTAVARRNPRDAQGEHGYKYLR